MHALHTRNAIIIEEIKKIIEKNNKERNIKPLWELCRLLYKDLETQDIGLKTSEELYYIAINIWQDLNHKDREVIRVFNPKQSLEGWESQHTAIKVITRDAPYILNSINIILKQMGINIHWIINKPISISREKDHINEINQIKKEEKKEKIAAIYIEIDRQESNDKKEKIKTKIESAINQIKKILKDRNEIKEKLSQAQKYLQDANKEDNAQFIEYILKNKEFNIFGYQYCKLDKIKENMVVEEGSQLGILKNNIKDNNLNAQYRINCQYKDKKNNETILIYKNNKKSNIYSERNFDNIIIRSKIDSEYTEHQFIGFLPKIIYNCQSSEIKIIDKKILKILKESEIHEESHDYNQLKDVLERFPRDEMLQESPESILSIASSVIKIKGRKTIKVFARKDKFKEHIKFIVYMPREKFNSQIRKQTQIFLQNHFNSKEEVEWHSYFDETSLTKTIYKVIVKTADMDIDVKEIEKNLKESYKEWDDNLNIALNKHFGESKAVKLSEKFSNNFPKSYQEEVNINIAITDIEKLEELQEKGINIFFYQKKNVESDLGKVRLRVYKKRQAIILSEILPTLENFGLKVMNEHPYCIKLKDDTFWISDFNLKINNLKDEEISRRQDLFQEAFIDVCLNKLEDDGFNKLILKAGISGRDVSIIRSYSRYMRQIDATFSQSYITEAITKHHKCAYNIIEMFKIKFYPNQENRSLNESTNKIEKLLEDIKVLDDDRIIRKYLDLIHATLRTNFYMEEKDEYKNYISLKFAPELITDIPLPVPKFEIFVYSPRFEGVHLRGDKVARGGLRWSDRMQDFRTEVLGLVKAQQVKNTVIVPSGAKGGFVCKNITEDFSREEILKEGQECYKLFIRGLLDITDNIVQGNVVKPENVICHGEEDPYLVVAADKGTATFSDIANEISQEYNFWLQDAFASGGSNGYDHKKMGITAKGGWESVKRHFYEIRIDSQKTDFTCIAIGDMSGDVFGNGMLLSKHIRLKAAFNHKHIFIDPEPDSGKTWEYRKQQFDNVKSWEEYDQSLISAGGGIFDRSAKSINLTKEIKQFLEIEEESLTPNKLINAILKAKVDLIWNGGVGTYFKSSKESDLDVGDRANDSIRINSEEIKAKIISEGGNLGCTQLGRIEFAAKGGRINADFIDNVGGVSCSDIEVNIKILLNSIINNGNLTLKQRNELLEDMTDEVSDMVIKICKAQTQTISIAEAYSKEQLKEQRRFIQHLEKIGKLDREIEFIPSEEDLIERIAEKKPLTRPEISVLLSYAKMVLKEEFNDPNIYNDDYFIKNMLINYFPKKIQDLYEEEIKTHALYKEIIATQLADQIVNDMGINFVYRLKDETGATSAEIGICYIVAKEMFCMSEVAAKIEDLGNDIAAEVKYEILHKFRRHTRRVCYWFLRNRDKSISTNETINKYKPTFHALKKDITSWLMTEEVEETSNTVYKYEQEKVSNEVAFITASLGRLFSAMDITEIALESKKPILSVGELYFKLRAKCQLYWLLEQINNQSVNNHWQALARSAFREELDLSQKELTITALQLSSDDKKTEETLSQWFDYNNVALKRWHHMLSDFKINVNHEFAKFSVLIRELRILVGKCKS